MTAKSRADLPEAYSFRFGPEIYDDCGKTKNCGGEQSHGLRIGESFPKQRLDVTYRRREKHSDLICQSGEESAQLTGRQLVNVRRYHSPCALHHELHEES